MVSSSYGAVEDFEVMTSVVPTVEFYHEGRARDVVTHASMRQDSYEFIVNLGLKTATIKNGWKERPMGPKEITSMCDFKI
jgi:hypothetical protein